MTVLLRNLTADTLPLADALSPASATVAARGIVSLGVQLAAAVNLLGDSVGKLVDVYDDATGGTEPEVGKVNTTDATVTTVWSKTLEDNALYEFDITLAARRTNPATPGTAEGAVYRRRIVYTRDNAGAATAMGSADTIGTDQESTAGYAITISTSTNDVLVRATGAASHNIAWTCYVSVKKTST